MNDIERSLIEAMLAGAGSDRRAAFFALVRYLAYQPYERIGQAVVNISIASRWGANRTFYMTDEDMAKAVP